MAFDPHAFWDENYYKHPPLTDAMVAEAESILGVSLPEELISLLRVQNGGYTKGFAFPMTRKASHRGIDVLLEDLGGIVTDPNHQTAQNILQTAYMTKEWDLPPKQVLLSGDGHTWITLDYRVGPVPAVTWIDLESEQEVHVANTFKEFLDGLIPAPSQYVVA